MVRSILFDIAFLWIGSSVLAFSVNAVGGLISLASAMLAVVAFKLVTSAQVARFAANSGIGFAPALVKARIQ
jgi:hypothetical protein